MTALLCPILQEAQLTDNNEFLAGGRIWFYQAGTDQSAFAYTTEEGDVAWSNPIILNSRGETGGTIWLAPNQSYRIVVENKPYYGQVHGTVITEHDNISGIPVSVDPSAWLIFGGVPSTASSNSFTVSNDYRDIFVPNIKLKLSHSGGTTVHSVVSSTFASGITTVTVTDTIPPGIASVQYSFVTPDSSPNRFTTLTTDDINVSDAVTADRVIVGSSINSIPIDYWWNNTNNTFGTTVNNGIMSFKNGFKLAYFYQTVGLTTANTTGGTYLGNFTFPTAFPTKALHAVVSFGVGAAGFFTQSKTGPYIVTTSLSNTAVGYELYWTGGAIGTSFNVQILFMVVGY